MQCLQGRIDGGPGFEKIVSCATCMREVFDQARRAALADVTVLLCGESGTGKELLAEAIHLASPRKPGPFVTMNMAAVPETLIESEIFGHVEGAFTGAGRGRTGRFEAAHRGSIFIDEIGDLKLTSQAKLLRVLEDHQITPVGSNHCKNINVRVIAATNRDLDAMVAAREFREDLYYRLNVITIALPALRDRREDILPLTNHFLDKACQGKGKPRPVVDTRLGECLERYDWPGNVRQLRNCVQSMVVLARGSTLVVEDLPPTIRRHRSVAAAPRLEIPHGFTLEDVEQAALRQTLDRCEGNRTQAARSLGISVRTLQRRLRKWEKDDRAYEHDHCGSGGGSAAVTGAAGWR